MAERTTTHDESTTIQRWDLQPILWLILAALQAVLLIHVFHPHYSDLGSWDESNYINSGRLLAHGYPPYYALNPLVASLYAVLYELLRHQTFWMLLASGAGLFILFCLNWLATFLIARQMRQWVSPLVFAGFLIATPVIPLLLQNSSDASFAALSAFGFWKLLQYLESNRTSDLWQAAWFVGLSAFCRNDGAITAICLATVATLHGLRMNAGAVPIGNRLAHLFSRIWQPIAISIAPLLFLLLFYTGIHFALTHDLRPGTRARTYTAFEQGQFFAYASTGRYPGGLAQGNADCDRLYGTIDQNNSSVLTAIRHNPRAWAARIVQNARTAPVLLQQAYGPASLVIAALFILGVFYLWRSRVILSAAILWPAQLVIYFGLFFRAGYFALPYFAIAALAGAGITGLTSRVPVRARHWVMAAVFALLLAFSRPMAPTWPLPLGTTSGEQALEYLHYYVPKTTRVAAIAPKLLEMDSRRALYVTDELAEINAAGGFAEWMQISKRNRPEFMRPLLVSWIRDYGYFTTRAIIGSLLLHLSSSSF